MKYSASEHDAYDYAEAKPVLLTFLVALALLLGTCVFSDADAYFYAGSFPAAAMLTLRWYRGARAQGIPRWLSIVLWAIVVVPLAVLTTVVLATR